MNAHESRYRFGEFLLDAGDRQLWRTGERVDLSARYFDALLLLVRRQGELVVKDRFFEEVWKGVPVTDEALTQCIKTLRRQLGDSVAAPRFIETVPKHGYRFIARAELVTDEAVSAGPETPPLAGAGVAATAAIAAAAATVGGGVAGALGGLIYGFAAIQQPLAAGMGAASVLLVLLSLCILVGAAGALGVGSGIAAAAAAAGPRSPWTIAGGALGGLVVGSVARLLGLDAFNLLLGHAPDGITGGLEGLALGAAIGLGIWLGGGLDVQRLRRPVLAAAGAAGAAGALIPLAGGKLMAGSLAALAGSFPGSRLDMAPIGRLLGEERFGTAAQVASGAIEGLLFGGCVAAAMLLGARSVRPPVAPAAGSG